MPRLPSHPSGDPVRSPPEYTRTLAHLHGHCPAEGRGAAVSKLPSRLSWSLPFPHDLPAVPPRATQSRSHYGSARQPSAIPTQPEPPPVPLTSLASLSLCSATRGCPHFSQDIPFLCTLPLLFPLPGALPRPSTVVTRHLLRPAPSYGLPVCGGPPRLGCLNPNTLTALLFWGHFWSPQHWSL